MHRKVLEQVADIPRTPKTIGIRTLRTDGTISATTSGTRSQLVSLTLGSFLKLRQGPGNPLSVALPAFESFTSDGTGGNTETFSLANDLMQCPNTEDVIVWIGGSFYGVPDSVDYANNSIDVTDPGTNNDVYVWYIARDAGNIEFQKAVPSGASTSTQELYTAPTKLVNEADQSDQPEYLRLGESRLHPWVATDMSLEIYVDAPYTVRLDDPNGDGAYPTNALFQIPVEQGPAQVDGFGQVIKADMGQA